MLRKLSIAVVAVMLATATVAALPATTSVFAAQNQANERTIGSCKVIDQPGRYTLTKDIRMSGEQPCITITATNVTLDGNGHSIIEQDSYENSLAVGTSDSDQWNVTVTNLTTNGPARAIDFENVTRGQITNLTALKTTGGAIRIHNSSEVTVADSVLRGSGTYGIRLGGSEMTVRNNTIALPKGVWTWSGRLLRIEHNDFEDSGMYLNWMSRVHVVGNHGGNGAYSFTSDDTSNLVLRENEFNSEVFIRTVSDPGSYHYGKTASNITIENNTLSETNAPDIDLVKLDDVTISNNTITSDTHNKNQQGIDMEDYGNGGSVTIENNTIRNHDIGVYVESHWTVTVRDNEIVDNSVGLRNLVPSDCGVRPRTILVHGNVIANNSQYGIRNDATHVLNATGNYWGASNGPSSPNVPEAPLKDPETGTGANGNGGTVSESPNVAGVSNVHFDSWLTHRPEHVGDGNETAA